MTTFKRTRATKCAKTSFDDECISRFGKKSYLILETFDDETTVEIRNLSKINHKKIPKSMVNETVPKLLSNKYIVIVGLVDDNDNVSITAIHYPRSINVSFSSLPFFQ